MEITGKVLREVEFRDRLRGYDTDEVDEFLEEVAIAVDELHGRVTELTERLSKAPSSESAAPEGDTMPVFDDESIRRTLVLAQRTADLAIKEANEEAQRLLENARREAETLVGQATENARRLREDADEEYTSRVRAQLAQREQLEREVRQLGSLVGEERGRIVDSLQTLLRYVTDNLALNSEVSAHATRETNAAEKEVEGSKSMLEVSTPSEHAEEEALSLTTPLPVVNGSGPGAGETDDELWSRWSESDALEEEPVDETDPFGFNRQS